MIEIVNGKNSILFHVGDCRSNGIGQPRESIESNSPLSRSLACRKARDCLARPISRIASARSPWYRFSVQRFKAFVALVLALVWVPAASCCLIDASGLLGKRDCCSKEHSHSVPGPGNCDEPCGTLASATYLSQQEQLLLIAPVSVLLFDFTTSIMEVQRPYGIRRDQPATAPPDLPVSWQFSFRTALSPRAPSFAS